MLNYPALQPLQRQRSQPAIGTEAMIYPSVDRGCENWDSASQETSQIRTDQSIDSNAEWEGTITPDSTDTVLPIPTADHSSRRRPFQSYEARAQTAETRQLVACIRCRMQRIRVCV